MRRWNSTYRFAWKPIITFGTRRLRFLDWVEANLEPVAFSEGHDHVGVALYDRRLKVTVRGNGMVLEDGLAGEAGVAPLAEAVAGVFEVFEPTGVVLRSASIAWSHELAANKTEAQVLFAQRMSGIDQLNCGLRATDASGLMDFYSDSAACQAEWGVVGNKELLERISSPSIGRLAVGRDETRVSGMYADELPESSVFVDTLVHQFETDESIADVNGVYSVVDGVDALSVEVASKLYEHVAATPS